MSDNAIEKAMLMAMSKDTPFETTFIFEPLPKPKAGGKAYNPYYVAPKPWTKAHKHATKRR